jgi:hypothetical protein
MRVIWISVGIFLVVGIAGYVMFEPEIKESLVASQQAAVENPFVENTKSNESTKSDIDLAVLPIQPTQQTLPTDGSSSNAASAQISSSPEQSSQTIDISEKTNKENDQAILIEDTSPTVAGQAESDAEADKEKKKLGPSMLVFEREKKKNKVAVIIHENNSQQLTAKEIKALYLDRLTRWSDGSRVMLYNLPLGDKYRDMFSKSVLKMTALEADKQEIKRRELRIKANDVEVKSKNVVISYVEQHPNAVAYVPLSLVREKSGVKVVFTIP